MINWQVVIQILSVGVILLAGPIVIVVLAAISKENL